MVSHLRGVNDYSRYDEHAVYDGECPEQSVKAVSHLRRREDPASEKYRTEYWYSYRVILVVSELGWVDLDL